MNYELNRRSLVVSSRQQKPLMKEYLWTRRIRTRKSFFVASWRRMENYIRKSFELMLFGVKIISALWRNFFFLTFDTIYWANWKLCNFISWKARLKRFSSYLQHHYIVVLFLYTHFNNFPLSSHLPSQQHWWKYRTKRDDNAVRCET